MNKQDRKIIKKYLEDIEENMTSTIKVTFCCDKIRAILKMDEEKYLNNGSSKVLRDYWKRKKLEVIK